METKQTEKTLASSAKYMLKHQVNCDVTFSVGDCGYTVQAHRLILGQRSPVFDRMFYGLLAEVESPVIIPDVHPAAFNALLR